MLYAKRPATVDPQAERQENGNAKGRSSDTTVFFTTGQDGGHD
jgi:hypothetical protein